MQSIFRRRREWFVILISIVIEVFVLTQISDKLDYTETAILAGSILIITVFVLFVSIVSAWFYFFPIVIVSKILYDKKLEQYELVAAFSLVAILVFAIFVAFFFDTIKTSKKLRFVTILFAVIIGGGATSPYWIKNNGDTTKFDPSKKTGEDKQPVTKTKWDSLKTSVETFESLRKEDGERFAEKLRRVLEDHNKGKTFDVKGLDSTYAIYIVVDTFAAGTALQNQMKKESPQDVTKRVCEDKGDFVIWGRYADRLAYQTEGWLVKDLHAFICNEEIANVFEYDQALNEKYIIPGQSHMNEDEIVNRVADIVEYVLGISANYKLAQKAISSNDYHSHNILLQTNQKFRKLAADFGDSSLAEFQIGNNYYWAASKMEPKSLSIPLFQNACIAYQNSIFTYDGKTSPIKREPLNAYMNWAKALKKISENSNSPSQRIQYADSTRGTYEKIAKGYPDYFIALEEYRQYLQETIKKECKEKSYEMTEGKLAEWRNAFRTVTEIIMRNISQDPTFTEQKTQEIIQDIDINNKFIESCAGRRGSE